MKKSAFPLLHSIDGNWNKEPNPEYGGISQRLYIATKILAGTMSSLTNIETEHQIQTLVENCYILADELIKQDSEDQAP